MRYSSLFLAICVLLSLMVPVGPVAASELCFPDQPDIKECLDESFAPYWQSNGGLPVFGYPITAAQLERSNELDTDLLTQWTERNRLELHPEKPEPFRVLLGRMGAERLAQLGRDPRQEGRESGPRAGCLWFAETGHNVCDQQRGLGFKSYWERNGLKVAGLDAYGRSLMLFGLPLTAAQMERSSSGELIMTQWFERARFEWHPNNPDRFKVLLGLLGREVREGALPDAAQPSGPGIFGVEINRGYVSSTLAQFSGMNVPWVRYNGIRWADVEATQGVRDWSKLADIEAELKAIVSQGGIPMLIVRSAPAWAQQVAGKECGPIKPAALDAFASFMGELVTRYSAAPYNVRYWELGNEPDADFVRSSSDWPFGCWGDPTDAYYGGGAYAEMLKRVYPAIKAADPNAQVIVGGLLLDCDPTQPLPGRDCKEGRFLEGILRNGGGAAFDILAYHGYMYWGTSKGDWDLDQVAWKHRGGAVLGKLDFIRENLRKYGVDKPIIMNEGGLLCYRSAPSCSVPAFYNDQANYVVRLYARSWANSLKGAVWYTLNGPGWQEGGLLDPNQSPRPAYQTLRFMATLLKDARYIGNLSNGALEGYAFRSGATTYQIYWTNNRSQVALSLPAGTQQIYTVTGQASSTNGTSISIGFEPVFLEIR